ncbi:MAG: hypothetical protein MPEBLZ_02336 [Candidatus Methanoperedens nitroreducens]|uniref:Uncharacterized protein n=1 Tax=Candidatus Methanoperedens nitratireducens TaxID=1392998 RepID=A0A0P8C8H4_9EURY|nr:MAG: hypothetical protein MPEBLZ_02336 [Candidatus Methanoperedens sp. BLZ1]CAG0995462.1 hypothetical protein METP2_02884 [Methanosarcinales archaeon]
MAAWYRSIQRLRTRMIRIGRISTDPCVSALSVQSVFHCYPSAFICVYLRFNFHLTVKRLILEIYLSNALRSLRCLAKNLSEKPKPQRSQRAQRFFKHVSVFSVLSVVHSKIYYLLIFRIGTKSTAEAAKTSIKSFDFYHQLNSYNTTI